MTYNLNQLKQMTLFHMTKTVNTKTPISCHRNICGYTNINLKKTIDN